jgi:hypothetical protein
MIVQNIYLKDWDWDVTVYYAVDSYYIDEIIDEMINIGCRRKDVQTAKDLLSNGSYNIGLTYSNYIEQRSIVVIGLTSTPDEFQNTFDHEKGHLAMHIGKALDIDIFGEEYQYLTGKIGQSMFKVAKGFMCEHCKNMRSQTPCEYCGNE